MAILPTVFMKIKWLLPCFIKMRLKCLKWNIPDVDIHVVVNENCLYLDMALHTLRALSMLGNKPAFLPHPLSKDDEQTVTCTVCSYVLFI